MSDIIKVGVIGAGRIGRIHAANLASKIPGAAVGAVWDPYCKEGENSVADLSAIFDDDAITAVAICSPTDTHARLIEEAAAAGKHIFCEKPIDLNVETTRSAIAAAKKAGVKLQIGFNRRFDPDFKRVKDLVIGGKIGAVHAVTITSRDPEPPPMEYVKGSGGLFLDMTIHDFDMARFIAGEVKTVYAEAAALVDPALAALGEVDSAALTLTHQNGALTTILNSRKAVYGYDQRLEVFGTEGLAEAGSKEPGFFLDRYREAYILEMTEFIDCVRDDRAPSVTGEDGLEALILGLAANRSLVERRPVAVKEAASWLKQPLTSAVN